MQQKCHGQYPGVFVYVLLCMHTLYAYVCIQCTNMYVRAYTLAPAYRHMFNAHPLAQLMRWTWSGHGGGWILSFVRFWSPPSPFLHSLSQGRPLELTNWIKYTWCLLPTPFERSPAGFDAFVGSQHHGQLPQSLQLVACLHWRETFWSLYGYAECWR